MKFPGSAVVLATAALLAGAAATPVAIDSPSADASAAPSEATTASEPVAPEPDYTTQMSEPPLVGEYDPATAPPPMYAAPPGDAGGLRQCVGADGVPIFTDRRCEDLGATPQQAPAVSGARTSAGLVRVRSCARNQDDLLAGVRAALESHDANRLAEFYHWTGMGSTEGYRLMERLDAFSSRPVVDVQLVRSADPEAEFYSDLYFDAPPPMPRWPGESEDEATFAETPAPPPRRRSRLASLLRVDQMRSDTDVASTVTYFRLLTNAGCWWMRF